MNIKYRIKKSKGTKKKREWNQAFYGSKFYLLSSFSMWEDLLFFKTINPIYYNSNTCQQKGVNSKWTRMCELIYK